MTGVARRGPLLLFGIIVWPALTNRTWVLEGGGFLSSVFKGSESKRERIIPMRLVQFSVGAAMYPGALAGGGHLVNCERCVARDIQFAEGLWVRAKSLDTYCPMGPALVTRDEVADPHALDIKCILIGEVVQHSTAEYLLFGVPYLVSFMSRSISLLPGDIISTGTPGGVGYSRRPQLFPEGRRYCLNRNRTDRGLEQSREP